MRKKTGRQSHSHGGRLSSLELFVGAGGLALGTSRAGFRHVAVVDSHDVACETLRLNKANGVKYVRDWQIIESNVEQLDFRSYAGVDLIGGGPPCQPFSQAGKRRGRSDDRDMFPQLIRAVRECQPKAFIVENVKGLIAGQFVDYFTYIVHQLRFPDVLRKKAERWSDHRARLERLYTADKYQGPHYRVIWQSLNAADFGVGQRRERVFVVGVRADLGLEYSFPVATHSRTALIYDQFITGEYWDRYKIPKKQRLQAPAAASSLKKNIVTPTSKPWRTVRDTISDLPQIGVGRTSHRVLNHFLNPGARVYAGHTGSILDAPAKTIKAGHNGVPGGENMLRLDDGKVRYFSVRECARLQSFPDDWELDGSWCGCMRQIGNAVPVALAEATAYQLAITLAGRS